MSGSFVAVCGLLLVLGFGACRDGGRRGGEPTGTSSATSTASARAAPALSDTEAEAGAVGPPMMPRSFASLARKADPAVVTLKTRVKRPNVFGHETIVAEGLGSAFFYDPNGFLLTSDHVIESASEIIVGLADDRELEAKVIGRDQPTDLAVLKVEAQGLPTLRLGDSDAVDVGDWVVAIGSPFGLKHTVSAGILSGRGRTSAEVHGLDRTGYFSFLQTDASINPGNSGGPLLNLAGEVVGINTAIQAGANGIGFAIPSSMVRQLLPMLLRDGRVRRSQIGVLVDALEPADVARLGRPDRHGALVVQVMPGGPGDRAGLARDDVVLAFDGKAVADPSELRWLASIAGVDRVVVLRVARGKREFDMRVTLAELSPQR